MAASLEEISSVAVPGMRNVSHYAPIGFVASGNALQLVVQTSAFISAAISPASTVKDMKSFIRAGCSCHAIC